MLFNLFLPCLPLYTAHLDLLCLFSCSFSSSVSPSTIKSKFSGHCVEYYKRIQKKKCVLPVCQAFGCGNEVIQKKAKRITCQCLIGCTVKHEEKSFFSQPKSKEKNKHGSLLLFHILVKLENLIGVMFGTLLFITPHRLSPSPNDFNSFNAFQFHSFFSIFIVTAVVSQWSPEWETYTPVLCALENGGWG